MVNAAADIWGLPEGTARLLEHCAALDRGAEARPAPAARLELVLGSRLTRLLLTAFASDHRARSCGLPS